MEYISFAKENNVTPVLITPVGRMYIGQTDEYRHTVSALTNVPAQWSDMEGKKGDWPQTMKDVAVRENIMVLDLTSKSVEHFGTFNGNQAIRSMYSWNNRDATHFNKAGAEKMAEFVVELACASGNADLCNQFKDH